MAVSVLEENFQLPLPLARQMNTEAYYHFLEKLCSSDGANFAVFSLPFECSDLLPYLGTLDPNRELLFYFETPRQNQTIAAGGSLAKITAEGPDRFTAIEQQIQNYRTEILHFNQTSGYGYSFLGGFSFFDQIEAAEWQGFQPASFTLPKRMLVKDADHTTVSISVRLQPNRTPEKIHRQLLNELKLTPVSNSRNIPARETSYTQNPVIPYSEWRHTITDVKHNIADGKLSKIVLARQLSVLSNNEFNYSAILNRLRNKFPNCRTYLIRPNGASAFIGSTPEKMLSFRDTRYQTEALAGSMPRGSNAEDDKYYENKLYDSQKNRIEHELVVNHIKSIIEDEVENSYSPAEPVVAKLANVQHLRTPIHFNSGSSPLQILKKLHPTPALGGYPQKEAMDYLEQNGLIKRGWFGAPIGWISGEGKGEFSVAIRGGLVNEKRAELFAGCGIVADSDAKNEWNESNLKFRPMLSALQNDPE